MRVRVGASSVRQYFLRFTPGSENGRADHRSQGRRRTDCSRNWHFSTGVCFHGFMVCGILGPSDWEAFRRGQFVVCCARRPLFSVDPTHATVPVCLSFKTFFWLYLRVTRPRRLLYCFILQQIQEHAEGFLGCIQQKCGFSEDDLLLVLDGCSSSFVHENKWVYLCCRIDLSGKTHLVTLFF